MQLCHSPEGTPLRDGVSGSKESLIISQILRHYVTQNDIH
jgi:hypothetical protein